MSIVSTENQKVRLKDQQGTLYVVATPIGNFDDVSDRMRHTLASVSKIAAEDTRRTKRLLSHIDVDTPCFSFHDHNERQKLDWIVQLLESGESVALVSDAGTPLISDPGYPLVTELRSKHMKVVAIPGPCAFVTALSIAGLPTDRFIFEGFLPSKSSARIALLKKIVSETATSVFYESSHRIKACIADIAEVFGNDRKIVVARELTKTFERLLEGTALEIVNIMSEDPNQSKGEFVVLIKGAEKKKRLISSESEKLALLLVEHFPGKKAAKIVNQMYGDKKNQIYDFLLSQQK